MFELFAKNFERDYETPVVTDDLDSIGNIWGLAELLSRFGGASFRNGLYRIMLVSDLSIWKQRIVVAFPEFEPRVTCFGYDWVGSAFAVDSGRLVDGRPGVVIFEPGTGKALEVPCNLQSFHETGLKEFGEAALAMSFNQKWLESGGVVPTYQQCVGYKKPLFLGGEDIVENLEISDIDVYWHLMGQIIRKTRGLPKGTRVNLTS